MLMLTIGNYTVKREDKFNITLSVTRPKKVSNLHKNVDGHTTEVIGYYSTLESALKSLLNRYVLDDGDVSSVKEVLEAISKAEALITHACSKITCEQPSQMRIELEA